VRRGKHGSVRVRRATIIMASAGAPGGERWEVYTVLADSWTFWRQDGSQSWEAAEAALNEPTTASRG
jgi:hypothetical protein